MADQDPLILEGISLPDFINYVLEHHHVPSTTCVCGSKETFLDQLASATKPPSSEAPDAHEQSVNAGQVSETAAFATSTFWTTPTLRLLATSRTVTLAFCPDIAHLRAYLATYAPQGAQDAAGNVSPLEKRILAVLNPVALHRPTSAFSAQGLNRTFSIAVEAAHRNGSRLVLAECENELSRPTAHDEMAIATEETAPGVRPQPQSPWDEEVSILNVTTKSFGAGERGWVGRTVKLRQVAGRCCTFQRHGAPP